MTGWLPRTCSSLGLQRAWHNYEGAESDLIYKAVTPGIKMTGVNSLVKEGEVAADVWEGPE